MTNLSFLRRSKAGHSGSLTLALLPTVGATAFPLLGTAPTHTSRGLFGHGHSSFAIGSDSSRATIDAVLS